MNGKRIPLHVVYLLTSPSDNIASYITSAALAPKPTLQQHLVMLVKSSRPPGWTFGPILYGIGAIHSGMIPKTLGAWAIAATQVATLSFPLCIGQLYTYSHVFVPISLSPCC